MLWPWTANSFFCVVSFFIYLLQLCGESLGVYGPMRRHLARAGLFYFYISSSASLPFICQFTNLSSLVCYFEV